MRRRRRSDAVSRTCEKKPATRSDHWPPRSTSLTGWWKYYEAQTDHPPAHLVTPIADALGNTVDQLLGRSPIAKRRAPQNERLIRQLRQVEKLPPRARQSVIEHIEGLVSKFGTGD